MKGRGHRGIPRRTVRVAIWLAACLSIWAAPEPAGAQAPAGRSCEAGPFRGFDFWIGEWDVFLPDGRRAGSNRIEATQGGCLLVEHWSGATGFTGTSFNHYHPGKGLWVQLWVSADGTVIEIEGGLEGGAMRLAGTLTGPAGAAQPFRGSWTPNADGTVRQHFEISADGGRSWTTWFDGRYVRR